MEPIEIISQDVFDKIRSRFSNLMMGDKDGMKTDEPKDARIFDFDFAIEGASLGRVSISINELGSLKVFFSQGITENLDPIVQDLWYDFLKEMRFFAKRRLLRFDARDITKSNLDKTDFAYLANNGPKEIEMNESNMFGSSKTSHRPLEDTDLIIRHTEAIDPSKPGARSRKIKNLFIQNKEGERFKFPFVYLPGARAMQRHVANGGYPHDAVGKKIVQTCEEILKLSDFGRKIKHSTLNDNAHQIAEKAGVKLKQLRHHMECMSKQGYYEAYVENFKSDDDGLIELDEVTIESYKNTFTVNKFDEALMDMFPLLHSIMQEAGTVDLDSYLTNESDLQLENGLPPEMTRLEDLIGQRVYVKTQGESGEVVNVAKGHRNSLVVDLDNGSYTIAHFADLQLDQPKFLQRVKDKTKSLFTMGEEFENWTDQVTSQRFSDDEIAKLEPLVQQALPVGANDEAVQALAGIGIKDPELVSAIRSIAHMPNGAEADARQTIKTYMGTDADKLNWGDMQEQPEIQPNAVPAEVAESYYLSPEDLPDWTEDAANRVAQGKVSDWTELYAELVSDLGIDDVRAERIAKRIVGHEKLQAHRVKAPDDLDIANEPSDDTDDDEFLNSLRAKSKSSGLDEEDLEIDPKDRLIEPENTKAKMKEVAKVVMGFYDRDRGTWTKGEHGVVTHVKREFANGNGEGGEHEAKLAEKLINYLNQQHQEKREIQDMRKLSGLESSNDEMSEGMRSTDFAEITIENPNLQDPNYEGDDVDDITLEVDYHTEGGYYRGSRSEPASRPEIIIDRVRRKGTEENILNKIDPQTYDYILDSLRDRLSESTDVRVVDLKKLAGLDK